MQSKTFHLKKPSGWTMVFTLVFVFLLFSLLEVALRLNITEQYRENLVASLGSRHHQLEIQISGLEKVIAQEGSIDCIVMGSSLVWLGINPAAFEQAYANETGQEIKCYNFGIETMPASAAGKLVDVIIDKYQPSLLIYGTSARDYAVGFNAEDARVILETPWLLYQMGDKTLLGWLYTHSNTFRYLPLIDRLVRLDTDSLKEMRREIGPWTYQQRGFLAKTRPAQEIHFKAAEREAVKWLSQYTIHDENLTGLEDLLSEQGNGLKVLVVEMPVPAVYYDYFGEGRSDYDRFLTAVKAITQKNNTPLIGAPTMQLIPQDGWWDTSHMNAIGAEIYSDWLGQRVGKVINDSNIVQLNPTQ